jgi:thioester reductase-like protein
MVGAPHRSIGWLFSLLLLTVPSYSDVTDEKALRIVHQAIVETFPPIVGVLNGAMVLRDVSVRNMSFEQVTDAIRPKVLGSIHLDRIFHDTELDFFILLSSANCIIGNAGQANYAAANMGMCAVAANRRGRGLRSSTANVGAIIGVGYITESARQLDLTVISTHLTHLNEEDFHQIFAEVMEAGYLDSPLGLELSTGLLEVSTDDPNMPKWFTDPKFGRLIVNKTAGADDKKERMNEASILDSLQQCKSEQDVFQVIQQAFAAQLRKTLQITTSDEEIINMRSSNLGLDSLISVDMRSWFLKNFQVSIPVLKIMAGDAQMSSLVEAAVAGIPSELVPQVPRREESISSGTDDGDEPGGPIDWEAEVTPPKDMPTLTDPNAKVPDPNPKVVLLTGASGLLGHHLVNALAAEPSITKIICVAVRRLSERIKTKQLPPPSARLVYYEGDLGLPRFGLTEEQQEDIFSEVDAVIHNGADTSHLKYYMALKETNVESTRQLARLCLQRMVPLHYVSSAGMALYAGMPAFPEISGTTSGAKPPVDGRHGYMCAKWVSESYLERVNAAYGLKIWIQRPSTIVREGSDATEAKADFDWVNALIHYAHRTRAVPKVENNQGAFDLVYVHSVCDDIVGEMLRNEPRLENGMTYVHNVGDIVIPMNRMAEIGKHKGIKSLYKVLPWGVWIATAIKAGLHPAVAALVELFDAPGAQSYPLLLKEKRL